MTIERVRQLQERSSQLPEQVGCTLCLIHSSTHNNFCRREVRRSWVSSYIVIRDMTDVEKIYKVLELIEEKSSQVSADEPIIVSSMRLGRSGLTRHDVRETLALLSTIGSYRRCIEVIEHPDLMEFHEPTKDVVYQVKQLPNFNDILQKYHEYYLYEYDKKAAAKLYPRKDMGLSEAYYAELEQEQKQAIVLKPESYNKATGTLELKPGLAISIPKQGKVKKSTGEKYFECKIMEKLFNSQTTLSDGVSFHSLVGIHKDKRLKSGDIKKVENVRTAINKKLSDELGLKKLIKLQRNKAYINHLYLLKN